MDKNDLIRLMAVAIHLKQNVTIGKAVEVARDIYLEATNQDLGFAPSQGDE